MAESTPLPTSRRALLAATLGAAAASVAGALGRPAGARAADTGNMIIGQPNASNTVTELTNGDDAEVAFHARSTATGGPTNAIVGEITTGLSLTSAGVKGISGNGVGVRGTSVNGTGVAGDSASGSGVYGVSGTGHGVYGAGGSNDAIRGVATGTAAGVSGHSTQGVGVVGSTDASLSVGVRGVAQYFAVWGEAQAAGGIGVVGTGLSGETGSGYGVVGGVDGGAGPVKGTGVAGYAGQSGLPPAVARAGVLGVSDASDGFGVYAEATDTGTAVFGYIDGQGVIGTGPSSPQSNVGVHGLAMTGTGVLGASATGTGVSGSSSDAIAVKGYSSSATKGAIVGHAVGQAPGGERAGVMGYSGQSLPTSAPAKTGVYGYAAQDSNANGVYGRSTSGRGVYGLATSGSGLYGSATTGYALRTSGRLKFEKTSGFVVIASGASVSTAITPGVDLTSSSLVLATIQGNGGANTSVKRVAIDTVANTFTITLTTAATANVKVAWLVVG